MQYQINLLKERKKELYDLFKSEIAPLLSKYEAQRKTKMRNYIILRSIYYLSVSLLTIYLVTFFTFIFAERFSTPIFQEIPFYCISCFLLLFIYLFNKLSNAERKKFLASLKKKFLPEILPFLPKVEHTIIVNNLYQNCKISSDELNKSSLFRYFDKHRGDDSFVFSYKNNKYNFCVEEKLLRCERGRSNVTTFKGCVILFKLNKRMSGKTILFEGIRYYDLFRMSLIGGVYLIVLSLLFMLLLNSFAVGSIVIVCAVVLFLGFLVSWYCFIREANGPKEFLKIKLQDKSMKHFFVKSTNPTEALSLLTPDFLQRLKILKSVLGTNNISCSFYENSLMIAVETREDLFEVANILTPLTDYTSIHKLFAQIASLYDMAYFLQEYKDKK